MNDRLKHSVKPFIKWVGGKGQLISTIANELPAHLFKNTQTTYVEPFVGGGAMLFWILKNTKIEKAIINDINSDLTKAYLTVKENVNELILCLKEIQKKYDNLPS